MAGIAASEPTRIHEPVRGRFRKYPEYRDSGVEWIGQIPAHWDVTRTKFVARLRSGHTPSRQVPEYWENCTIPWFGLSDVWQIRDGNVEYVTETSEKISQLGLDNSAARLLPKGTVIPLINQGELSAHSAEMARVRRTISSSASDRGAFVPSDPQLPQPASH